MVCFKLSCYMWGGYCVSFFNLKYNKIGIGTMDANMLLLMSLLAYFHEDLKEEMSALGDLPLLHYFQN